MVDPPGSCFVIHRRPGVVGRSAVRQRAQDEDEVRRAEQRYKRAIYADHALRLVVAALDGQGHEPPPE
jgi:hypothetical protein